MSDRQGGGCCCCCCSRCYHYCCCCCCCRCCHSYKKFERQQPVSELHRMKKTLFPNFGYHWILKKKVCAEKKLHVAKKVWKIKFRFSNRRRRNLKLGSLLSPWFYFLNTMNCDKGKCTLTSKSWNAFLLPTGVRRTLKRCSSRDGHLGFTIASVGDGRR